MNIYFLAEEKYMGYNLNADNFNNKNNNVELKFLDANSQNFKIKFIYINKYIAYDDLTNNIKFTKRSTKSLDFYYNFERLTTDINNNKYCLTLKKGSNNITLKPYDEESNDQNIKFVSKNDIYKLLSPKIKSPLLDFSYKESPKITGETLQKDIFGTPQIKTYLESPKSPESPKKSGTIKKLSIPQVNSSKNDDNKKEYLTYILEKIIFKIFSDIDEYDFNSLSEKYFGSLYNRYHL